MHKYNLILIAALIFGVISCENRSAIEGCTDPDAINFDPDATTDDGNCQYASRVFVNIDHEVSGEPLEMNQLIYENEAGNIYSVQRLRYFISDITFYRAGEPVFESDALHLRNAEEEDTRSFSLEENPDPGDYDKVSFVFGLDENKNISYEYSDNFKYQQMEWPEHMGGGYHYMQLDGRYQPAAGTSDDFAYNTHTGRIVYQDESGEDSAVHENYFILEFDDVAFTLDDNHNLTLDIVMDIAGWYEDPHTFDFSDYNGIMNDQDAQAILSDNGRNAFSIEHDVLVIDTE